VHREDARRLTAGLNVQIRSRFLVATIFCMMFSAFPITAQEHDSAHNWDYGDLQGPQHWGELTPQFAACKEGRRQSPIDIRNPQGAELAPIQFDYKASPLDIIDNGHTVMINYAAGSSISVGTKKFKLEQFHFHRPSEEMINGKRYEMVVHLVHADQQGQLAVVAVLVQEGKENLLVRDLWDNLPKEKGKEYSSKTIQIDAAMMLPASRSYYTFVGSLTTPPCTEGVTWFVLKYPVTMSSAQIERFATLYPNNARPIQPLYGRKVMETK